MTFSTKLDNTSVILFNNSAENIMHSICSPFFNQYGITTFTHCRLFNDGRALYLCSSIKWVENYINNKLYDDIRHFDYYKPKMDVKYSLWDGFETDKVFATHYELNIWHGIGLYETHEDYIDMFDFGTNRENYQLTNFYLNNMNILQQFIKDFKNKAKDLLNTKDQSKLLISKNRVFNTINKNSTNYLVSPKNVLNFMQQTKINKSF